MRLHDDGPRRVGVEVQASIGNKRCDPLCAVDVQLPGLIAGARPPVAMGITLQGKMSTASCPFVKVSITSVLFYFQIVSPAYTLTARPRRWKAFHEKADFACTAAAHEHAAALGILVDQAHGLDVAACR